MVKVVFISGFLTPPDWISHPQELADSHGIEIINVFPSATGSLHDRACEIFYELKGGRVDYGEEHSRYHGHERYGNTFLKGKYEEWDENHPIILLGHSFGGNTAYTLQNYLEKGIFHESHSNTSAKWVKAVICITAPLNGTLQVYFKGLNAKFPPLVDFLSPGYVIGFLVHLTEFIDFSLLKKYVDFGQSKYIHEHDYSFILL